MNVPAPDPTDNRGKRLERAFLRFADRVGRYISPNLLPRVGEWLDESGSWVPLPRLWRARALVFLLRPHLSDVEMGKLLAEFSYEEVARAFAYDPWHRNCFLNFWEFETGVATLTTYPPNICIPIADVCNARCTFCTSWLEGTRLLDLHELDAFAPLMRHAHLVGLAGHGEPLSHPKLTEILDRLAAWLDARAEVYLITNGHYLDRHLDRLLRARVSHFAISLNATTAQTHRAVMGLPDGAFDSVLNSLRRIVAIRNARRATVRIKVSISLVLTRQNMHEVADFVRLGNQLEVDAIQLKTLAGAQGRIVGLNYHELAPYDHPDYVRHKEAALTAIAESRVPVTADPHSWDTPLFPADVEAAFAADPPPHTPRGEALADPEVRNYYAAQEKFALPGRGALIEAVDDRAGDNPYGRTPRFACRAPYYFLYINDFSYNMSPCCYMGRVPGHEGVTCDGSVDFFEAWNSPAMVALRTRLRDGPLFGMCERCPGVY